MSLEVALYFLALTLAILGAIPPLRTYLLLHAAVVALAIGLVLQSGAIKP